MVQAISKTVTLTNTLGLHARAAAAFVKRASDFSCEIKIKRDDMEINGKSIMGLMMLAVSCGENIEIIAKGTDAYSALDSLVQLVEGKFGES